MDDGIVEQGVSLTDADRSPPFEQKISQENTPSQEMEQARLFSDETREKLQESGYRVFRFGDDEPDVFELQRLGMGLLGEHEIERIIQHWPKNCEIALKPGLNLDNSNNKTFKENEKQIGDYAEIISRQFNGSTAIMGDISQYVALEKKSCESGKNKNKSLFRNEYIRTKTLIEDHNSQIRNLVFLEGDAIDRWDPNLEEELLYLVPLIIPK